MFDGFLLITSKSVPLRTNLQNLKSNLSFFLKIFLTVSQIGSLKLLDRVSVTTPMSLKKRSSVKPLNAEPKRNDSMVPLAATMVAQVAEEVVEAEDFAELAKKLENASPLEIMDKALEMFGNDIAIAFRYINNITCSVQIGSLNMFVH